MKNGLICCVVLALTLGATACQPPDEGNDPPIPDLVGIWMGSDMPTPGFHYDVVVTLTSGGTYESLLYDVGGTTLQDNSNRGTYTWSAGVLISAVTEVCASRSWTSTTITQSTACTVVGDTRTLSIDFTGDGVPDNDWVLTRQEIGSRLGVRAIVGRMRKDEAWRKKHAWQLWQ
jgi:hypothetical protein